MSKKLPQALGEKIEDRRSRLWMVFPISAYFGQSTAQALRGEYLEMKLILCVSPGSLKVENIEGMTALTLNI